MSAATPSTTVVEPQTPSDPTPEMLTIAIIDAIKQVRVRLAPPVDRAA